MSEPFKTCTICACRWNQMADLIQDRDLFVNGYQASFDDAYEGLFLFTHTVEGCGTTFSVPASALRNLYDGPDHTIHMSFTDRCEGHCMYEADLAPCANECDMRWARDIIQVLKNHGPEEFLKRLKKSSPLPQPSA